MTEENIEILRQHSRSLGQDLNPGRLEYEVGALTTGLRSSVAVFIEGKVGQRNSHVLNLNCTKNATHYVQIFRTEHSG